MASATCRREEHPKQCIVAGSAPTAHAAVVDDDAVDDEVIR
jgi:hypothetical protein